MDPKIRFFFYLASVVCFALAALAQGGRAGRAGASPVGLVPLGLALFVFPLVWDAGELAF
ncbi:MAG: hypothetical protein ACRDZW_03600 [Acidimicrobiales bacterium]